MLKSERLSTIISTVNRLGVVTVNQLVDILNVSSMTIRRDLDELGESNEIVRIHGGAQSKHFDDKQEPSYIQKRRVHIQEKTQIAKTVASMIDEGETVFFGPGTTNELVAKYLKLSELRVVTNSLPVFQQFHDQQSYELILVGGTYRERSGTFIGSLTNDFLKRLNMTKAFVSVNGIMDDQLMNANPEEGKTQTVALNNSIKKYVVADHSKLDKADFYKFYSLNQINGLITDSCANKALLEKYAKYTKIY